MEEYYLSLNDWLRQKFGRRIQKLTVDAGFPALIAMARFSTGGCIFCNDTGSGSGAFSKGISITDQIVACQKNILHVAIKQTIF
jgi:radical SAM superfamily enzyme